MTCICGMVRNNHVYMAGDLMGSNGFTGKVYPDSKVFVNGEFIIGYTSSFRMGQILEWNWQQPLRQEGISDREYMQLNVVESLRETFAAFGYGVKSGLEDIGGNFLIGYHGKLYEMQDNFSLLSVEDFAAVGSGQYHAEAILHLLHQEQDLHPFYIMQTAIGTAAHFTQSVSHECTVYSSDENAEKDWNDVIEEQERLFEESLNGEPLPVDKLESLEKHDLIRIITGEMEDEEFDSIFNNATSEDTLDQKISHGFKVTVGDWNITIFKDGIIQEELGEEWDEFPCVVSYIEHLTTVVDDPLYCKEFATSIGVDFPHNIGQPKLLQKIEKKLKQIVEDLNK